MGSPYSPRGRLAEKHRFLRPILCSINEPFSTVEDLRDLRDLWFIDRVQRSEPELHMLV